MKILFQSNSPRKNRSSSVLAMVRSVYEKNRHTRCYALEDIAKTLDDTYRNVMLKVRLYKWAALALLTLIPVLSAFLSVLVSDKDHTLKGLAPALIYVSYLLTLLTILSSIFNPGERFKRICLLGIKLGDLKTRAIEGLERLQLHDDEAAIYKLAEKLSRELRPYREQLVELFLPEIQSKTLSAEQEAGHGKTGRHKSHAGRKSNGTPAVAVKPQGTASPV
jgi:hypothetical protein